MRFDHLVSGDEEFIPLVRQARNLDEQIAGFVDLLIADNGTALLRVRNSFDDDFQTVMRLDSKGQDRQAQCAQKKTRSCGRSWIMSSPNSGGIAACSGRAD
jgi:hypothetical protein